MRSLPNFGGKSANELAALIEDALGDQMPAVRAPARGAGPSMDPGDSAAASVTTSLGAPPGAERADALADGAEGGANSLDQSLVDLVAAAETSVRLGNALRAWSEDSPVRTVRDG